MQTWEPLRPPQPPVLAPSRFFPEGTQADQLAPESSLFRSPQSSGSLSASPTSLFSPSLLQTSPALQTEPDRDLSPEAPSSAPVSSPTPPPPPRLTSGPAQASQETEADPSANPERTLTGSPLLRLQRRPLSSTFDRISILSPQIHPSSGTPSLQAQPLSPTAATPQLQAQADPDLGSGQQVVVPEQDINDRRQVLIRVFIEVYGLDPEAAARHADWNINNAGEACQAGSELFRVGAPVEQDGRYVVTVEPSGYCGGDVYTPSTPSSPITQGTGSPGSGSASGGTGNTEAPACDPADYAIARVDSSGEGLRFTLPGISRTISLPTRSWQMTEYDHIEVIRNGGDRQRFERGNSITLSPGDTLRIPLYNCPAPGNEPTATASAEQQDQREIIRQTEPRSQPVGDQPQILMNPPAKEAVPGTRITYTLHIPRPPQVTAPGSRDPYSYRWSVINDLSQAPGGPETHDPGQRNAVWENAQWDFVGNHTVICRVEGEGRRFEVHYVQTVRDLQDLTRDTLAQIPEDQDYVGFRTGLELKHLEVSQRGIPDQEFGVPSITNSGPNPAVPGRAPNLDRHTYTITPSPRAQRFRWTVAPQEPIDIQNFHGFQRSEENGQEIYDLGSTSTSARWIISHRNVYTIRCEEFDQTGQPLGTTARYVQTVMSQEDARQVERFRDYLGDVSQGIDQIETGQEVAIRAAYVRQESAAQTSLALFIGPDASDPSRVKLVDLTPGASRIEYGGRDAAGALDAFDRGNSYPHGQILLEIPQNDAGIPPQTREIEPNGRSFLQGAADNLGWASLGLAGLGLLALTNPITAVAAPYLFVASAGSGGISAGLSLADELQQANPSGIRVAIDVAGLASSILGGAAAFRAIRQGAAVTLASQGGRFLIYSGFTADAISGVLVSVEGVDQINQILNAEGLSPRQQADAIARILANLAVNAGLLAYGAQDLRAGGGVDVPGTRPDAPGNRPDAPGRTGDLPNQTTAGAATRPTGTVLSERPITLENSQHTLKLVQTDTGPAFLLCSWCTRVQDLVEKALQNLPATETGPVRQRLEQLRDQLTRMEQNMPPSEASSPNTMSALMGTLAEIDQLSPGIFRLIKQKGRVRTPNPNFSGRAADPDVITRANQLFPDIFQELSSQRGLFRGNNAAASRIQEQAEAIALQRALIEVRTRKGQPLPLGLEPGAPPRLTVDPDTDIPMGFFDRQGFETFSQRLYGQLQSRAAGAQLVIEGSSVTGRRFDRIVDQTHTGTPFDLGRLSDYDIAIISPSLYEAAKNSPTIRMAGDTATPRTEPLTSAELSELGLGGLASTADSAILEATGLGHSVNFKIYSGEGLNPSRPHLPLPRTP